MYQKIFPKYYVKKNHRINKQNKLITFTEPILTTDNFGKEH